MWPWSIKDFEPESFLVFVSSFAYWLAAEVKQSEEVVFRDSSKNDIRLGRDCMSYAAYSFRSFLKEQDFWSSYDVSYFSEASQLCHEASVGVAHFQDRVVQAAFVEFVGELNKLVEFLEVNAGPLEVGSINRMSIITKEYYGDDYSVPSWQEQKAKEANEVSEKAWLKLEALSWKIRERIPEAFDEPLEPGLMRTHLSPT